MIKSTVSRLRIEQFPRVSNARQIIAVLFVGIPLGLFVLIPLGLLVLNSFREIGFGQVEFSLTKLTLNNYLEAYNNSLTWRMLQNSIIFATGAMLVSLLLGGTLAFLVERTNVPFRQFGYLLVLPPLILPGVLEAVAWALLLGPNNGLVNKLWFSMGFSEPIVNAFSMPVMWIVQGIGASPLAFLLLGASLRRMDPSLEEAGLTSGSSPLEVMFRITARLMLPALAGVALLQFVRALEAMETPLFLGMPGRIIVFSTNIFLAVHETFPPQYGLGFSYSVMLIALTMVGLLLYRRVLLHAERYAVVGGKGYRPRILDLGKWKPLGTAFMAFYLLLCFVLPLGMLLWVSLLPGYEIPSAEAFSKITLINYLKVIQDPRMAQMVTNTAILAVVTGLAVMLISLLISWLMFRTKVKGREFLDTLAFLPYAIPSLVVAVAFMALFLSFRNPIYGTIWILVLAYILSYMPMGTRFTNAGLAQIHKELEEAAQASGSTFWTVLRRIVVPLMMPSLIAGGLYVFILSVKQFSIPAILSTPDMTVLAFQVWWLWREGLLGQLGALAVLLMGVMSVVAFVWIRLGGRFELG